jgi:hypothetical protein
MGIKEKQSLLPIREMGVKTQTVVTNSSLETRIFM